MSAKSAFIAVALTIAGTCGSSPATAYPSSEARAVRKAVVVDGRQTRPVAARKHFVVPHHKVVIVEPKPKKIVHKTVRKANDF